MFSLSLPLPVHHFPTFSSSLQLDADNLCWPDMSVALPCSFLAFFLCMYTVITSMYFHLYRALQCIHTALLAIPNCHTLPYFPLCPLPFSLLLWGKLWCCGQCTWLTFRRLWVWSPSRVSIWAILCRSLCLPGNKVTAVDCVLGKGE